jgi:hypothetical protein
LTSVGLIGNRIDIALFPLVSRVWRLSQTRVTFFDDPVAKAEFSPLVSWSGTRLTRPFRHGDAAEQAGVTSSAARVLHCCRMAFDGGLGRAYSDQVEAQPSSRPELLVSVCFSPLGGS